MLYIKSPIRHDFRIYNIIFLGQVNADYLLNNFATL